MSSKPLSCLLLLDTLCSYVKSEKFTGLMDRCLRCEHYFRFLREMEDEEERFFEEVDRLRREGHG